MIKSNIQVLIFFKKRQIYLYFFNLITTSFMKKGDNKCLLCDLDERHSDILCCNSCGTSYHGSCLSSPLDITPLIRLNWQCADCKQCQVCNQPGDDTKVLVCESCDKCFHSYCLKSDSLHIPNSNSGWQCGSCLHKTLDLNKKCQTCQFYLLKDSGTCYKCLIMCNNGDMFSNSPASIDSNRLVNIKKECESEDSNPSKLMTSKKLAITSKKKQISKKSNNNNNINNNNNRNLKRGAAGGSSAADKPNGRSTRSGRNNGINTNKDAKNDKKTSQILNENSQDSCCDYEKSNDEPTIGQIKRDDEDHHAVTIITSLEDSFELKHDICLSCGSFGRPNEDPTIACSQCGQCFHTYCSGITNLKSVMLERGWRCLDCTVCEGCGKATDEGRLLLCDDCDISYHIYCLNPPLDQVPKGNWKCKWCVKCSKCGSRTPGKSFEWKNNYTECALCFSTSECHLCEKKYTENELVGKCVECERWSHLSCKNELSEEEAEKQFTKQGFTCSKCHEEKLQKGKSKQNMLKRSNFDENDQNESIQFLEELGMIKTF
jgi:hypothetical protein